MMDVITLLQNQFALSILIFVRISGMIIPAPIFGSRNIPTPLKAGFCLFLTITVLPLLADKSAIVIPQTLVPYLFLLISELLFGLIIGFASSLVFSAVQMTGSLLDMQVGFGVVNIFDPQVGHQVPLIGNFKYILALFLFLTLNGHHILLTAILDSFQLVPITGIVFTASITEMVIQMFREVFIFAIKITVPVIAAVIITDLALGILARTMPQMNVFVVGVPAKIIVGLFVLSITLPFFMIFLEAGLHEMYRDLYRFFDIFIR